MATLKVGDRVEFTVDGKPQAGTITRVYDGSHEMYDVKVGAKTLIVADTPMTKTNACRNAVLANALNGCARNADEDINMKLGRATDRLASTISGNLKKLSEDYAYWIERNCGTEVRYLLEIAQENKNVQPSIIAELKRQRKRIDDAIAASKRLPR